MGRNSGGSNNYAKGGSSPIAVNSNGRKLTQKQVGKMLTTATSTGGMKNRDMEKQINRAISRYEKVMGVRERHVRLADIDGAYGVTYIGANGSQGIYLSRRHFDTSKRKFEAAYKKSNYDNGFKNVTNTAYCYSRIGSCYLDKLLFVCQAQGGWKRNFLTIQSVE